MWKKTQTNCTLIASNFVTHPQVSIFSVFKIAMVKVYKIRRVTRKILFTISMEKDRQTDRHAHRNTWK